MPYVWLRRSARDKNDDRSGGRPVSPEILERNSNRIWALPIRGGRSESSRNYKSAFS